MLCKRPYLKKEIVVKFETVYGAQRKRKKKKTNKSLTKTMRQVSTGEYMVTSKTPVYGEKLNVVRRKKEPFFLLVYN